MEWLIKHWDWLTVLLIIVPLLGYYLWKAQPHTFGHDAIWHPDAHVPKPGESDSPDLSTFWHGGAHP